MLLFLIPIYLTRELWKQSMFFCNHSDEALCVRMQLCQMGNDNSDIIILKVDFDENRDVAKPLAIKVCSPCRP